MAAKVALRDIAPLDMALIRFLLATIVLWPLGERNRAGRVIERNDQYRLWVLGLLAIPINQGFFLYGLQWTTTGHAALLYGLTPMFVMLFAAWKLKERITLWRLSGIVLALAGVILVLFEKGITLAPDQFIGDVFVLIAVVAWALYTVLGKPLIEKYGAMVVTARAMTYGTILFIPLGLTSIVGFEPAAVSAESWMGLLYCALLTSVVAYSLWFWALKFIDATQVAVFNNFQPVIAAMIGYVLLGEPLTSMFVGGGVLVLIGVFVTGKH